MFPELQILDCKNKEGDDVMSQESDEDDMDDEEGEDEEGD